MIETIQITPFMHVRDLEGAVGFMEEVLGFRTIIRIGTDYAYLEREGAALPSRYLFGIFALWQTGRTPRARSPQSELR